MDAVTAILGRNLINFVRDKGRLLGSLAMSFLFLFVFSFVMKSSMGTLNQPMNYLISGIVIMTVFQQSMFSSTDILTDIASGFMKEILVAPISRAQISIGQVLSTTVTAIVQGLIILVIGLFMGLQMDVPHFIEMLGVMALTALTFSSIGLFLATVARNSAAFQVISGILTMPLTFLSGAYIPTTMMPGFLRPFIYINPLTYVTAVFRYITLKMDGLSLPQLVQQGVAFDVNGFTITPVMGLLMIVLIGVVFFMLCVHKFNKANFSNVKVFHQH